MNDMLRDKLLELFEEYGLESLREAYIHGTVRDKNEVNRLIMSYLLDKPAVKSEVQVTDTNATHLAALMKYGNLGKEDFMSKVKLKIEQDKKGNKK